MTIYLIARGYPTKQNPQWGCFEKDQALALAQLGHHVVILSYRQHPFLPNWGYQVIDKNGIHAVSYNFLPGRIFGNHGAKLRVRFEQWELKKAYLRAVELYGKPDVIYSHYLFITTIARYLKEQFHIPLVAIEHWSVLQKSHLPANVLHMAESYQLVDRLITVSQSLQTSIERRFHIRANVVNNMVGNEFSYAPIAPSMMLNMVATGSLIPRKGYDVLINALINTSLPKDKWHLSIIGSGREFAHLSKLIAKLHLQDNICLLGPKNKQEIVALYQQSDIFVLPSRMETFGVVYIEALACGLPVIATPCGGPEEFVTEKNGILVPIEDVDSLTKAIEYMFIHHQGYDRKAIADDCQARFSSKVIAKQLTAIFEDVVAKHKQR